MCTAVFRRIQNAGILTRNSLDTTSRCTILKGCSGLFCPRSKQHRTGISIGRRRILPFTSKYRRSADRGVVFAFAFHLVPGGQRQRPGRRCCLQHLAARLIRFRNESTTSYQMPDEMYWLPFSVSSSPKQSKRALRFDPFLSVVQHVVFLASSTDGVRWGLSKKPANRQQSVRCGRWRLRQSSRSSGTAVSSRR